MSEDLYELLDVPRDADRKKIRAAYRRAAKRAHPDVNGGSDRHFALIKLAHDTLTDDEARRRYDETGEFSEKQPDNGQSEVLQAMAAALEAACLQSRRLNIAPFNANLPLLMKEWLTEQMTELKTLRSTFEQEIDHTETLALEFMEGDVMQTLLEGRKNILLAKLASTKSNIASAKAAMDLLKTVRYRGTPSIEWYE